MTLPGVNINELDGQLGIVSGGGGQKLFAIVGPSSAGPTNTPSTYTRAKDLVAAHGGGAMVEAAAYYIERYQRPVLVVRTAASTTPSVTAVAHQSTGTSVVSIGANPTPVDAHEMALQFLSSGTVGQSGITYRLSYDRGRTWSQAMALGTANTIDAGNGVTFALAAGTVVIDDVHTATTTPASWAAGDLQAALAPLGVTSLQWEFVLVVGGAIDETSFDVVEAVKSFPNGRHSWIGAPRLPNAGETEAAYRAALETLSGARASGDVSLYAGGAKITSAISARSYRRPFAWAAGCRQAAVAEHINIADVDLGPLPGVSIRDVNGTPDEHDEALFPGLDDLRFGTARTWPRRQGVYVTLPRTFAATGSDFEIMPNRRVLNLAREGLLDYLVGILHKPLLVSRKTGFILSHVAKDIELGADAVLAALLLATPKASGAYFRMSRTDNLLSLPKITCGSKVLPLAYPRWIDFDLSFENPALNIQPV